MPLCQQHCLTQKTMETFVFWCILILFVFANITECIEDEQNKYSSHICMGGDQRLVPEPSNKHEYLCHFKNICYSTKDEKFLYYSDEKNKEIIRTVQHVFEHKFADDYMWFNLKSVNPKIDIIEESMPMIDIKSFTNDVVMHYSLMYYGYQHLFIDHFYAMWRTLKYFDLYNFNLSRPLFFGYESKDESMDFKYVHDSWNAKRAQSSWDHLQLSPQIGLKFIKELTSYIWKQKPLFLTFNNNFKDNPIIHNDLFYDIFEDINKFEFICFDSIVIEMGYYFRHWDISYFIQLFTEKHHNKNTEIKQEIQNILILAQNDENGRRHYTNDTNLEKIGKYLYDLFDVNVDIAYSSDIYNKMTLSQQIEYIEKYTILIHSGGDDSYIHWFMKEKTALITMDWFENNGKYTVHYDSDNIEFDPLKKTYYYYMTANDIKIVQKTNDKKRNTRFDSKNVYQYRLDPQRLAKYVYSALLWVEHWNEWEHHTFNKPLKIPAMT